MALAANQAGVDVAVVGYGPVGVVAANLLGGYGIRTVVLERDEDIYARARAVTVNDWTMRGANSISAVSTGWQRMERLRCSQKI